MEGEWLAQKDVESARLIRPSSLKTAVCQSIMCNLTLQNISAARGANKIAAAIKRLPGSLEKNSLSYPFVRSQIFEPWLPPPPTGRMFSLNLPHRLRRRALWFQPTDSCPPPGTEMTFPMIDYFEPFSGYIIAGLSSSLYSPYRHSIASKPQIESCNYPDCHLIAALLSALSLQVLLTHHRDRGKKRPACGTARHR